MPQICVKIDTNCHVTRAGNNDSIFYWGRRFCQLYPNHIGGFCVILLTSISLSFNHSVFPLVLNALGIYQHFRRTFL